MSKIIHRLWKDNNSDLLIMPGSLPLYDADTRNESIYYLPQGWDPVLERDVDGERAETTELESVDTRLGSVQACRRTARTIFLGSAPSTANQMVRGIELERVLLGCVQPGQQMGVFKDALRRLNDRLHYLNAGNNRFWFDTRPNLRREMEDRKRRFQDKDDVIPAVRERVQRLLGEGGVFSGSKHIFLASSDIPDDWALRLVVLPPAAGYSRSSDQSAIRHATEILKHRGEQPRFKQNRLIFLAPDADSVSRLKDQVRSVLAWQSIVADIKEMKLNLDQYQARQASRSLDDANEALRGMVKETYRWLLAPAQFAERGKGLSELQWEPFQINTGAQNLTQEIERVLRENELLITEWAPIHLHNVLKAWFWKDGTGEANALNVWQQTCQQLYLPRLKDDAVFHNTLAAGAESRDFFGFAQGKEDGRYLGFSFAKRTTPILDNALILIEPSLAQAEAERIAAERAQETVEPAATPYPPHAAPGTGQRVADSGTSARMGASAGTPPSPRTHFFGTIDLDPVMAKRQFAELIDEVVLNFTAKPGVKVRISIEIDAESDAGFEDGLQRAVRENCKVLRFKNAEFD
jgi:predicted AAA+ superfamily ATPase